jgi:hypothetical protein
LAHSLRLRVRSDTGSTNLLTRTPHTAHRWRRDADVVDMVVADHAAPSVRQRLRGCLMVAVEGGTQALGRTVVASFCLDLGRVTGTSLPGGFAALLLKVPAHPVDSRDCGRHLLDLNDRVSTLGVR